MIIIENNDNFVLTLRDYDFCDTWYFVHLSLEEMLTIGKFATVKRIPLFL